MLTSALVALSLAAAPTLDPSLPCFSTETGVQLTGTGWTPGAQVQLVSRIAGDQRTDTVTADVNGNLSFSAGGGTGELRRYPVVVTAQEVAHPELQATTHFTLSWFGTFFRPWNTDGAARGRPGKVSRIEASGYLNDIGKTLYAHYALRDEIVATVPVGRLRGPCGQLKRSFRQFAFKPVRRGTYSVYFDTFPLSSDDNFDSPGYRRVVVR